MSWQNVIGLEIHVQLKTKTKMFCSCQAGFGFEPNSRTCPVCLGLPGALPVANEQAVAFAAKLGLALNCNVRRQSVFARKSYFYPDLPKGYQISQYDRPICENGFLDVPGENGPRRVRIVRAHLEEDAAKTVHVGGSGGRIVGADKGLVDFNRGGTPLLEIVTAPDIHSGEEAREFLNLLRQTIIELGISDAEMEKGTLRCDANISVRPLGGDELRTRTELKNVNSFNFVAKGIEAEARRQVEVWEAGGEVIQQTFDFNAASGTLTPRRSKEEAQDYRYFADPDLPPLVVDDAALTALTETLPELPAARIERFRGQYGLSLYDAKVLNQTVAFSGLYEQVVAAGADAKTAANTLANEWASLRLDPAAVNAAELARMIAARDKVTREAFSRGLAASADADFAADSYLAEQTLNDSRVLAVLVSRVLAAHPDQVAQYRAGKRGLLGFFVGQAKREAPSADARAVSQLLLEQLDGK